MISFTLIIGDKESELFFKDSKDSARVQGVSNPDFERFIGRTMLRVKLLAQLKNYEFAQTI